MHTISGSEREMTKDFKQSYSSETKEAASGLGWMVGGIVIGLLIGLGMYFYNSHNATAATDQSSPSTQTAQNTNGNQTKANVNELGFKEKEIDPISVVINNSRQEQTEKQRATFSYYAVLPNLEMDVTVQPSKADTQDTVTATQGVNPTTEKITLPSGSSILQLASFRTMKKANQAQNDLAQRGIETHIEQKVIKGTTWFRLFMGPTQDVAVISSWKTTVERIGYQPIAVKIK